MFVGLVAWQVAGCEQGCEKVDQMVKEPGNHLWIWQDAVWTSLYNFKPSPRHLDSKNQQWLLLIHKTKVECDLSNLNAIQALIFE